MRSCGNFRKFWELPCCDRLFSLILLLSCSGCWVELTDFNFSGRPTKLTISVPEQREVETTAAKSLPLGPASYLDLRSKVQQGVIPLNFSDAQHFKPHDGRINALITLGKGGIISGGDDGQVILSRLVDRNGSIEFVTEKLLSGSKAVLSMALSPDRKLLAVAQTSLVVVYDIANRTILYQLSRVRGRIVSLAWDPRGELLALGLAGGDIYLWSLRQSFFGGQGRDSSDSIEQYLGGESPIVGLIFHPSGGAFISAELDGTLSIWRALRTEEELGLRDKFNLDDREAVSSDRQVFAKAPTSITDAHLSSDGAFLLVSTAGGKLSSWKIRGLVQQTDSVPSKESLLGFSALDLKGEAFLGRSLILTTTQDQKAQILCLKRTEVGGKVSEEYILLAESPPLRETISLVRSADGQIWGAEKADSIIVLNEATIANELALSEKLKECSRN